MQGISKEDVKNISNEILINMFPNKYKQILFLDKKTLFKNIEKNSEKIEMDRHNLYEIDNIYMPNKCYPSTIISLIHEKTHGLMYSTFTLKEIQSFPNELFPIINEKIATIQLENNYNLKNTYEENNLLRITNTLEAFENYYLSKIFYNDKKAIDFNKEYTITNVTNKMIESTIANYYRLCALDYILSEIYSILIIKYYNIDENKMLQMLRKVFNKDINIEAFLKYYNLNLSNKELIPAIKENLNKSKKLIITQ